MNPKPYELELEKRDDYLYVWVRADRIDRRMALDYLAEVAARCGEIRCKRMMMSGDIPSGLSTSDPAASAMADFLEYSRNIKIALVSRYEVAADSLERLVNLETERGVDVAFFESADEAEKWLLPKDSVL